MKLYSALTPRVVNLFKRYMLYGALLNDSHFYEKSDVDDAYFVDNCNTALTMAQNDCETLLGEMGYAIEMEPVDGLIYWLNKGDEIVMEIREDDDVYYWLDSKATL